MNQHDTLDFKTCTVCNFEKHVGCFSKQKLGKNGLKASCKQCEKQYQILNKDKITKQRSKYYQDNKDRIIARTRSWYKNTASARREYDKIRLQQTKKDPVKLAKLRNRIRIGVRLSKQRHPDRTFARLSVSRAISSGKLTRPSFCSECKIECKPDAHHDSYEREHWLDVRWLCRKCHMEHHRKYPDQPV